jgi:hypothetical protein
MVHNAVQAIEIVTAIASITGKMDDAQYLLFLHHSIVTLVLFSSMHR